MRYPHIFTSLVLTATLSACQAQGLVGIGAGGAAPGAASPAAKPAPALSSPAKLGAYEFRPLSADAAAQLAARASGARGEATAAAPMAPPTAGRVAGTAMSILPGSPYAHGSYFTGPYGPMKLDSTSEARGPGSAGSWAEIKAQVIAPVLADWTTDARLIASQGMLDGAGDTAQGTERWPGELGWRATYAAPSRNEVLEFHVTAAGSTITRLRWTPIDLNLDAAGVDAKAALTAISAAIKDANARSEEDKLGFDYFFGKPGDGLVGIAGGGVAVAMARPAIDPVAPRPVNPSDVAIAPPAPSPSPKPLYELTAGGRWNASLNAIGDKVVWELHYDPGEKAWQPPTDGWSVDPSAYGMVDARSGALIRYRRPARYYVGQPTEGPEPSTMTRPAGEPVSEPAPALAAG